MNRFDHWNCTKNETTVDCLHLHSTERDLSCGCGEPTSRQKIMRACDVPRDGGCHRPSPQGACRRAHGKDEHEQPTTTASRK
eukprot:scaffold137231_cov30-Tisochrysis_lutea.AAC.3